MKNFIGAAAAYKNAARDKASSRWPSRQDANRLEPEAWPRLQPRFMLQKGETVFTIGSCFARNIERYLDKFGFRVPMLDFTLPEGELVEARPQAILNKYTPPGILQELELTHRLMSMTAAQRKGEYEKLLLEHRDGVVDLELVGFQPVSFERALERREQIYELFRQVFEADVVTFTLGFIECWFDAHRGAYCQNAPPVDVYRKHKDRFFFKQMGYVESLDFVRRSIALLGTGPNAKRVLLTTSPVPIDTTFSGQDVLVANTYSKSVLRAVCGRIYEEMPNVDYFPSYENVMLTRQSYVWANDLLHVTDQFVGNIVDRLIAGYTGAAKTVDGDASIRRASALLQMSKATEALDILKQADHGAEGTRLEVLAALAGVATGDAAGMEILRSDAATCGLSPEEGMLAGKVLVAARHFDEAAEVYQSCLDHPRIGQTEAIECNLRLSRIRRRQGRLEDALARVEQAAAIAPNRAVVLIEQIDLAIAMNRHDHAVRLLKIAVSNDRIGKSAALSKRLMQLQAELWSSEGRKQQPKTMDE